MIVERTLEADAAARAAALDLRAAVAEVIDADRYRSPGPEIEQLDGALLMFDMAATAARWVPVGRGDGCPCGRVVALRGRTARRSAS
jgi:hypothetical protein